jgi:aminoglycoside phosphotransferase (APT) family kinase protein
VTRAIRDAFGDGPVEDVSVLRGGLSGATLLAFTVAGVGYVLRRPDPMRLAHQVRVPRELECMKIASELGVAPRLRHVDPETGVSIMDRVGRPLGRPRDSRRVERVASALRRLHGGPPFPTGRSLAAAVRQLDESLRTRGPDGLPKRLVETLDELTQLTLRFAQSAPCHLDLNPGNILETDNAIYFVDWETAAQSDPFLDIAELGVFTFSAPDARADLLEAYLARIPTEEDRARSTAARVMALGFYSSAFIHVAGQVGRPVRFTAAAVPISELLAMMGASRERAGPEVVAASLFEEMRRESETAVFKAAKRALTPRA